MLVLSPVVNYALETIGWRATLRWFGGSILFIGSLCSLPMVPVGHKTKNMQRHLSRSTFSHLNEDVCFTKSSPELEKTIQSKKFEDVGEESAEEHVKSNPDSVSVTKAQKSILRRAKLWLLCGCMFITAVAQTFYTVNYVSTLSCLQFCW